jgi:hypothetical protein
MKIYLRCINQLAKIGHHALVIKQRRILWISNIDYRINGITIMAIEVSPEEDMSIWKTSFLTPDSLDKS